MGNPAIYPPGNYTLWAESNVNRMNDNYDVTGKTVSKKIRLLNQGQNPLITKTVTTQTTRTSTQVTPQATMQTIVSTTVPTPSPTEPPTTAATVVPSPSPKAPGFEATLAIAAILIGLVVNLKKE
jgi:carbohydrate-binding DOMON domain-containing protein